MTPKKSSISLAGSFASPEKQPTTPTKKILPEIARSLKILRSWFTKVATQNISVSRLGGIFEDPSDPSSESNIRKCFNCQHTFPNMYKVVQDLSIEQSFDKTSQRPFHMKFANTGFVIVCPGCESQMCFACLAPTNELILEIRQCCQDGRLLGIAMTLARLDNIWLAEHTRMQSKLSLPPGKQNVGSGTGYGRRGDYQAQYTYSAYGDDGLKQSKRTQRAASRTLSDRVSKRALSARSTVVATMLKQLDCLLTESETFDLASLAADNGDLLGILLRMSFLGETLVNLLRNDSVMDIERSGDIVTYSALLSLMRRCVQSEFLIQFLNSDRQDKKTSVGLAKLITVSIAQHEKRDGMERNKPSSPLNNSGRRVSKRPRFSNEDNNKIIEKNLDYELVEGASGISSAILSYFEKLVRQSRIYLQQSSNHDKNENDDSLLMFCTNCVSTSHTIENALKSMKEIGVVPTLTGKTTTASSTVEKGKQLAQVKKQELNIPESAVKEYEALLKSDLQFQFVTDLTTTHHYSQRANSEPGGHLRTKWLMKELTTLSTSLPENIFVKADENQLELIKALIVGPDGTPYEGGLFE